MTILRLDGSTAAPAHRAAQHVTGSALTADDNDKLAGFASFFSDNKDSMLNLGDIASRFARSVSASQDNSASALAMPGMSM